MPFNHIHFNDQNQYGRILRRMLNQAEDADASIDDVRDMMIQMRDGDGTQDVHYAELTNRLGFASDAKARAAFELIDDAFQKITTNASVTNVKQSRNNLFNRLRG